MGGGRTQSLRKWKTLAMTIPMPSVINCAGHETCTVISMIFDGNINAGRDLCHHLRRARDMLIAEVLVGLATDTTVYIGRRLEALKVTDWTFAIRACDSSWHPGLPGRPLRTRHVRSFCIEPRVSTTCSRRIYFCITQL